MMSQTVLAFHVSSRWPRRGSSRRAFRGARCPSLPRRERHRLRSPCTPRSDRPLSPQMLTWPMISAWEIEASDFHGEGYR